MAVVVVVLDDGDESTDGVTAVAVVATDVVAVVVVAVVFVTRTVDSAVVVVVVDATVVVVFDTVVVVVVAVAVVELVVHPPRKDASDPSQLKHLRSEIVVGFSASYWTSVHSVIGVHSRSTCPGTGGFDSNWSAAHSSDVWQTMLSVAVPFSATTSFALHVPYGVQLCNECVSSFRNVPSGHPRHSFVDASRK